MAAIESGAECERLQPLLSVFADGEATPGQRQELHLHLRSCLSCRAALRSFRELPHRAAEMVPVAAAGGEEAPAVLWRIGESLVGRRLFVGWIGSNRRGKRGRDEPNTCEDPVDGG